jgi:5,10-methylene-tetrahydrofolate dehydrogenase/methenyl tetrahydrofolate cyclohydrolase
LKLYKNETFDTAAKAIELIHYLNYDPNCVGIIVQLPLPDFMEKDKAKILSTICPAKDPD